MSLLLPVNQLIPFSNVDREGNRLSVFVQGCQLNCLYCHNSETIQLCNQVRSTNKKKELCDIEDNNNINKSNLKCLLERHNIIEVRTVLINDYMDIEETIFAVADILKEYVDIPYKLIRAHLTGLKQ